MKTIIIGIAGGSASGKTTIAKSIVDTVTNPVVLIRQDDYYKDQSHLSMDERVETNYDHPFAFDTDLLINDLGLLKKGKLINKPLYDFKVHTRSNEYQKIEPAPIVILEGILSLENEHIRNLMDIKIYVDTEDDIRFIRRLLRDTKERGRSIDNVIEQYMTTVKPMHTQFIEPTKKFADIIIPEGGENIVAIDLIRTKINSIL